MAFCLRAELAPRLEKTTRRVWGIFLIEGALERHAGPFIRDVKMADTHSIRGLTKVL
ncbi:hypothetical protein ACSNOK_07905 [Streptomyces sp. URMC 126]|uniref:hypothetical protein n=1 Tax=Streptomyces sp. URMC 126 TaxID=3423401 RepID=UPI003F1A30DE